MSLFKKCDLCGRTISSITLDQEFEETLKIQLPTYNKRKLNFFITIKVEDSEDSDIIQNFLNMLSSFGINSLEDMKTNELYEEEYTKIKEYENTQLLNIKNLEPHLCRDCKKEIIKLASHYGSFNEMKNPIN